MMVTRLACTAQRLQSSKRPTCKQEFNGSVAIRYTSAHLFPSLLPTLYILLNLGLHISPTDEQAVDPSRTMYASAASCRASTAWLWNFRSDLKS